MKTKTTRGIVILISNEIVHRGFFRYKTNHTVIQLYNIVQFTCFIIIEIILLYCFKKRFRFIYLYIYIYINAIIVNYYNYDTIHYYNNTSDIGLIQYQ